MQYVIKYFTKATKYDKIYLIEPNRILTGGLNMKKYILYNPLAGHEQIEQVAMKLDTLFIGQESIYLNILEIESFEDFFASLSPDDEIVISGGDGTLNRFINAIHGMDLKHKIFYYATGSGNDFLNDLNKPHGSEPFLVNNYIKNLPTVEIDGNVYRFFNGIGYGIDGECCAEGDRLRKLGKKINYTSIAIKLILFSFRARNARVTVDGVTFEHKKVYLAPSMFGRFFGGGMKVAPSQKRGSDTLSVVVVHGCNKLRLLTIFPTIFKGEHVKYKKYVTTYTGRDITVEFDAPCSLQVDGEAFLDVKKYSAKASSKVKTTV